MSQAWSGLVKQEGVPLGLLGAAEEISRGRGHLHLDPGGPTADLGRAEDDPNIVRSMRAVEVGQVAGAVRLRGSPPPPGCPRR